MSYLAVLLSSFATPRIHFSLCLVAATFSLHVACRERLTAAPLLLPAACFENCVVALYKYVVPKPKSECSKTEQLGVSFAAGYIAGVFCAVVSQPADNLVSKLNSVKVRHRSWWRGRACCALCCCSVSP